MFCPHVYILYVQYHQRNQNGVWNFTEVKLWMIASCYVVARSRTWVLFRSSIFF